MPILIVYCLNSLLIKFLPILYIITFRGLRYILIQHIYNIPYILNTNILQLFTYLKLGAFINNIKYRPAVNIYNINNNTVVKVNIVL